MSSPKGDPPPEETSIPTESSMEATGETGAGEIQRHLRGSTALLSGRFVALAIEFAAHVVIVRYLAKNDFGAFSYALAVTYLLLELLVIGLPETLSRYAPMYLERRQHGKLLGSGIVAITLVMGLGFVATASLVLFEGAVGDGLGSEEAAGLLAILILTVPTEGINQIFQGVFAALGRVRAIFIRQYVLVPGLRLIVAFILVFAEESVTFLAIGYVGASLVGVLWYGGLAAPLMRSAIRGGVGRVELPVKELLSFALPVLVTDAFWIVLLATSTITLGVYASDVEVAEFQAVQPPARLNYLVTTIFSILFIPTISRLYARKKFDDLAGAYMSTTYWLTVLTVPLLALTTVFASVFVPTFFGDEYNASVSILVLLSAGYFFHSTVGPNSATLKVFRRLRTTVVIDVAALVIGIALNVVLVPMAGAGGAAIAFLLAVIARNVPYQWALRKIAGIQLLTYDYLRLQATVAAVLGLLAVVQLAVHPPLVVAVALSAASGLLVVRACRDLLDVEGTFPELTRGPLGR